ncbi:predicted protein [Lichtheimia corymbifera JMRC:FSU:9682]|uniref:Uncharacterized protein n=1 Tax=Lichtheimia corymbifera JMRC:FSU:9682 TaxID=1263082 RepID=A0A068RHB0_9FUNG|nr:predicted protein [Lichtheimia corymbifera JMRC:FSU:9682]
MAKIISWNENQCFPATTVNIQCKRIITSALTRYGNRLQVHRIYQETTAILHNASLPLPLSENGVKSQLRDAFGVHLHIMEYIEQKPDVQPTQQKATTPSWKWCNDTACYVNLVSCKHSTYHADYPGFMRHLLYMALYLREKPRSSLHR